jgi:hypothetical protein
MSRLPGAGAYSPRSLGRGEAGLLLGCRHLATAPNRWAYEWSHSGTGDLLGERENIRHKHGRYMLLVDLVHLVGTVKPRSRAARGCFGFTDDQWQSVDQEYYVEPLFHRAGPERSTGCRQSAPLLAG